MAMSVMSVVRHVLQTLKNVCDVMSLETEVREFTCSIIILQLKMVTNLHQDIKMVLFSTNFRKLIYNYIDHIIKKINK